MLWPLPWRNSASSRERMWPAGKEVKATAQTADFQLRKDRGHLKKKKKKKLPKGFDAWAVWWRIICSCVEEKRGERAKEQNMRKWRSGRQWRDTRTSAEQVRIDLLRVWNMLGMPRALQGETQHKQTGLIKGYRWYERSVFRQQWERKIASSTGVRVGWGVSGNTW